MTPVAAPRQEQAMNPYLGYRTGRGSSAADEFVDSRANPERNLRGEMPQDMPNTVDPAKAELWKAMGYPRWDLMPVYDSEVKPSRINWVIGPAIFVFAAFSVGMFWI
jgi:hypothetical protein